MGTSQSLDDQIADLEKQKKVLQEEFHKRQRICVLTHEVTALRMMSGHVTRLSYLIALVALHTGFTIDDVTGKAKHLDVVEARKLACYFSRELLKLTYDQISLGMGMSDHATSLHSCKSIKDRMKTSEAFRKHVQDLSGKIVKCLVEWNASERVPSTTHS